MLEIKYVTLILVINLLSVILMCLRYRFVLGFIDKKISYLSSFLIISIANSINYLMPFKSGVIIGNPMAAKIVESVSLKKGFVVHFFEQTFEILWEISFIFLAALFLISQELITKNTIIKLVSVIFLLLLILFFIVKNKFLLKLLLKAYSFMPNKIKAIVLKNNFKKDDAEKILENLKGLFTNKKFLLKYFLRTSIVILVIPINLLFTVYAFSISINYLSAFLVFWVSFILGRISGLPGGLGTREIVMSLLLVNLGLPTNVSIQIAFLNRILGFFPMLPTGIIYLLYFTKGHIKDFLKNKEILKNES